MIIRRWIIILGLAALVALALALPPVSICRDRAFIDRHTGSRTGHREWRFGIRSGDWYQASALEAFMRAKHPDDLRQDWVSYAGTERNIFGGATLFGHGRPGPIIHLSLEQIAAYCGKASEAEQRRLYDVLSAGEPEAVEVLVRRIAEQSLGQSRTPTEGFAP